MFSSIVSNAELNNENKEEPRKVSQHSCLCIECGLSSIKIFGTQVVLIHVVNYASRQLNEIRKGVLAKYTEPHLSDSAA